MSYSRITGLALLVSLLGAAEGDAKEKRDPSRVDLAPQFKSLPRTEQVDLCTEIRDEQKKKGKIFGTNPQCDDRYKTDNIYALCLDAEDIQGLRESGLTVTEHPWTEYATSPAEACSGKKVCAEVTAPAGGVVAQPGTDQVAPKTVYVCADGTTQVDDIKDCPNTSVEPNYQCADGTWRMNQAACPKVEQPKPASAEPAIKYRCEDGTLVDVSYECPHRHASTVLVRVETAQGYSEAEGRTGTLAGAVDVEVGAGIYLGGFVGARGDGWFFGDTSSSKDRSEDPQYIATESGDNLIGSQSDLEEITKKRVRFSVGPELLSTLYEGTVSVNAQVRVGLTRQSIDQRTLETTNYWAQTQDGFLIQEGVPGPTGPAETASSSETRYGLEPSLGFNVWLPAKGPLAVGVGVNGSYHHLFGNDYNKDNWEVEGTINLITLFGGDERK